MGILERVRPFATPHVFRVVRDGALLASPVAVDALAQEIERQAWPMPAVLVGESFAGFTALLFAHRFPALVKGLVLADSSHPRQLEVLGDALPSPGPKSSAAVEQFRAFLQSAPPVWAESGRAVQAIAHLGSLPLCVLAAGNHVFPPGLDPHVMEELARRGRTLQAELAALSTAGELRVVAGAGHTLASDAPDAIVEAVRGMLGIKAS